MTMQHAESAGGPPPVQLADVRITPGNVIRALQSRFPWLLDAKAASQRTVRRLLRRPFEPEFALLGRIELGPGVILDVGANRGQSIDAIRLFQPHARIEAFEPNGDLADQLSRRLAGDRSLQLNRFGLGNAPVRAPLHVPYYCGFMYDGLASFDRGEAASWIGPHSMAWFDARRLDIREVTCEVRVLDDLSLEPAFVKMDVQGFERQVLEGGARTLRRHKPPILMENSPDAESWLAREGWIGCAWRGDRLVAGARGNNNSIFYHVERRDQVAHLLV